MYICLHGNNYIYKYTCTCICLYVCLRACLYINVCAKFTFIKVPS